MKPPTVLSGFPIPDLPNLYTRFTKVFKSIKNLCELKDSGCTWNPHLRQGLLKRGWKHSTMYECVYAKQGLLLISYVYGACLISPSKNKIQQKISSLKQDYYLIDDG